MHLKSTNTTNISKSLLKVSVMNSKALKCYETHPTSKPTTRLWNKWSDAAHWPNTGDVTTKQEQPKAGMWNKVSVALRTK